MSDLAERIREAAEEVGGLKNLAELIDTPRRTLGSWLQGRKPKPEALKNIALAAGVSLHWLVSGDGDKHETDLGRALRLLEEHSGITRLTPEQELAERDAFEEAFARGMAKLRKSSASISFTETTQSGTQLDLSVMETLARMVTTLHSQARIKLAPEKVTVETARMYNDLLALVPDLTDTEMVEAALPQLQLALKRRLETATAEPGTGKRSAS